MKAFRLGRWGSTVLAPSNELYGAVFLPTSAYSRRFKWSDAVKHGYGELPVWVKRGKPKKREPGFGGNLAPTPLPQKAIPKHKGRRRKLDVSPKTYEKEQLPSPEIGSHSSKLSALHARLSLHHRLPAKTLARCLVHWTADPDHRFNNLHFAQLGNDLLGYHITEHLICHYPRLPMVVLTAAVHAYVGATSLASVAEGWGIEVAAEPGGEVDPGLLQFRRQLPTERIKAEVSTDLQEFRKEKIRHLKEAGHQGAETLMGSTSRGKLIVRNPGSTPGYEEPKPVAIRLEDASQSFVKAVFGAIYLHCGTGETKEFFNAHILSRHLDLATLFNFREPTRDLTRLCAREGFEPPIARVIAETGRQSRHPVFVVGVFCGRDKIGEDAGASLNEARFKAAAKALKGWYLYSPKSTAGELLVPSIMLSNNAKAKTWTPAFIDKGELVL